MYGTQRYFVTAAEGRCCAQHKQSENAVLCSLSRCSKRAKCRIGGFRECRNCMPLATARAMLRCRGTSGGGGCRRTRWRDPRACAGDGGAGERQGRLATRAALLRPSHAVKSGAPR